MSRAAQSGAGKGMRELSISMNSDSVRAIMRGRKTQTRRVIKPQPESHDDDTTIGAAKARYQVGDLLWVRERWRPSTGDDCACYDYCICPPLGTPIYASNDYGDGEFWGPWKSPVTMPKKAVRIWLRVTDVRAERLQDISEVDARSEGVELRMEFSCREMFQITWDTINAKRGHLWKNNPWVWVYEFTREFRNE